MFVILGSDIWPCLWWVDFFSVVSVLVLMRV